MGCRLRWFRPLGLSRLSAWWLALGIDLDRIDPGCPSQNGGRESTGWVAEGGPIAAERQAARRSVRTSSVRTWALRRLSVGRLGGWALSGCENIQGRMPNPFQCRKRFNVESMNR
jgi:hypothetical protein